MPASKSPSALRIAALFLRTAFILVLIAVTTSVSMPQNETLWTVTDTPLDVVRLLLGLAVIAWLLVQLFRPPRDAHAHRTWIFIGLVAIPVGLICLYAVW